MKILAIDGNSIMNRAFYGIKMLSNSKGFYTNALTGFMNIYLKEADTVKPDCVAVAFDLKAPTFRHKKVETYKANRKGMPEELRMQMPKIKEILTAMGITVLEAEGFEADDILGTLSEIFSQEKNQCYILTGDRDSLQLVSDTTTVRLATNKETVVYTPEKIKEVYNLSPKQLIEVKALMGDSSDNISGVAGIGEKTALDLVQRFNSVDGIYENLSEENFKKAVFTKLSNGKDDAYLSRWLGTIVTDAPISRRCEDYLLKPRNNSQLREILADLEMFRLSEKIAGSAGDISESVSEEKIKLEKIPTEKLTSEIADSFSGNDEVCFILGNDRLSVFAKGKIFIGDDFRGEGLPDEACGDAKETVLQFLENPCRKICFEGKSAYKLAFSNERQLNNLVFCADLAGYLLNSQASDYTVENLCGAHKITYRRDMDENADIASVYPLYRKLSEEIKLKEMEKLFYEIEMPLCEVLASMEIYGVKADTAGIKAFGKALSVQIKEIEQQIYIFAGKEFNISSPKQLGVVLFEDLGLPAKKKTKSGYSTNAEVLESLVDKHPIISLILEYRTLTKLNSTYVDGLLKEVHADGRVHSVFKQTETRTGRISSTEPNMQNIPVRKELGRNMRKFFVADEGKTLVDADYSQIELRVLAAVCDDENMKEAFLSGGDIHAKTASQVFGVPEDFVSPEMRSSAKAVNFGIIYGMGAFSLSKDINVSVADAKKYIDSYLKNFRNVEKFMNDTVDFGLKNGYVTTIFNRRRYIPELMSSNKTLQAFGKRAAMNAPIQGASADIIKIAMVSVYKRLKEEKLDAKLILQVHDELIIECDREIAQRTAEILKEEMESCVKLSVPLTADVNTGDSWYLAKG